MAEKIADLSGNEREERVAALKRKMQEAAQKKAQAAPDATPPVVSKAATLVAAAVAVHAPAPVAEAVAEGVAVGGAPALELATAELAVAEPLAATAVEEPAIAAANGVPMAPPAPGRPAAPARLVAPAAVAAEAVEGAKGINRREFLTYAWGAALGLLTLEAGVGSFLFLYPRFRAGEFGGDFFKPLSEFRDPEAPPEPEAPGKFWMVTTAEGEPKALYMVCVHLGCLYKWEASNKRFECPCHGSKYTHDGDYIEGPATRSLDWFDMTIEGEIAVVHTGQKNLGAPAAESPAAVAPSA